MEKERKHFFKIKREDIFHLALQQQHNKRKQGRECNRTAGKVNCFLRIMCFLFFHMASMLKSQLNEFQLSESLHWWKVNKEQEEGTIVSCREKADGFLFRLPDNSHRFITNRMSACLQLVQGKAENATGKDRGGKGGQTLGEMYSCSNSRMKKESSTTLKSHHLD